MIQTTRFFLAPALVFLTAMSGTHCAATDKGRAALVKVHAVVETDPVPSKEDAADDIAFWRHPTEPEKSLILGTDKNRRTGGMGVYDLQGKQLAFIKDPGLNNVDVRQGVPWKGDTLDIAVASRRTDSTLAVYQVRGSSPYLSKLEETPIRDGVGEVYGLCLHQDAQGGLYAFVPNKRGEIRMWRLSPGVQGGAQGELVAKASVGGQAEGCVSDDEASTLFVGEEEKGIWAFAIQSDGLSEARLIDSTAGPNLRADVEGLALMPTGPESGYLLASSQGSNSFAVYQREAPNTFLFGFAIETNGRIDGTQDTDGIEAAAGNWGKDFPEGLFVAQDGENGLETQNFKLVSWKSVLEAAGLESLQAQK